MTLSIAKLCTECHYAECRVSYIVMLNVVMLNGIVLIVVMLNVNMLIVVMLIDIMLSVVMLSVVAPIVRCLVINKQPSVTYNVVRLFLSVTTLRVFRRRKKFKKTTEIVLPFSPNKKMQQNIQKGYSHTFV
jgi:hypothetical protein